MLAAPTSDDLAAFAGRPATTLGAFAPQALAQATLMFTIVTGLSDLPDDPDLRQLALNAIMELADRILLEQPYQAIAAGPFQTETLGSYSYSRITATTSRVQQGIKTGLLWWDLAIDTLTVAGSTVLGHGSVQVLPDGLRRAPDGPWTVVNAAEEDGPGRPPYVRIS